jgi:hypothetical protein
MHSRNIGAYLDSSEGIGSLMPQAARLLELRRQLSEILPKPLAKSCEIANYKQGKVVIFAENGAIAAKLAHYRPKLISLFSGQGMQVTAIEVSVQVRHSPEKNGFSGT